MTSRLPKKHPLYRLFAGALENVFFGELGLCDPCLVDYLVGLMIEFLHTKDIYPLKSAAGTRLYEVADMLVQAHLGPAVSREERDRLIHRHVGDYTLYWTGVFPESLQHFRNRRRKDFMVDYYRQGKKSYAIASELSSPQDEPPAAVLQRLSDHFEFCAHGLTLARRAWDDLQDGGPPNILLS